MPVMIRRNLRDVGLQTEARSDPSFGTPKTATGAHRRTVIVSVLQSLRANLGNFSLATVLEEIGHSMKEEGSLFAKQWQAMQSGEPETANTG